MDGVALQRAHRRKERTYPELVGPRRKTRLVVLGVEVGGRMSTETTPFLSQLAKKGTSKTGDHPHAQTGRTNMANEVGRGFGLRQG